MTHVIEGDRVVLRPADVRDVFSLRRFGRTPTAMEGFPEPGEPAGRMVQWLQEAAAQGLMVWVIVHEAEVLGVITAAFNRNGGLAQVSYDLDAERQGIGLTTEALRLLSAWIFRETEVQRVELSVTIANIAMWRVAQRAGFVLEGVARARCRWAGVWHDVRNYALLRAEWEEAQQPRPVTARHAYVGHAG